MRDCALRDRRAAAGAGPRGPGPYDPFTPRSLAIGLPDKLSVGANATITIDGYAFAGDRLDAFLDPRGRVCPGSPVSAPPGAIQLVSELLGEGAFEIAQDYVPQRAGTRSFCAYLTDAFGVQRLQVSEARPAIKPFLRKPVARRAVKRALERHGFARRVVKAHKADCRRRSRNVFSCRLSARFPGYKLKGRGLVRLGVGLSYSFRVKAQGVRLTLTDGNEETKR